jgi:hypothetical protein
MGVLRLVECYVVVLWVDLSSRHRDLVGIRNVVVQWYWKCGGSCFLGDVVAKKYWDF